MPKSPKSTIEKILKHILPLFYLNEERIGVTVNGKYRH